MWQVARLTGVLTQRELGLLNKGDPSSSPPKFSFPKLANSRSALISSVDWARIIGEEGSDLLRKLFPNSIVLLTHLGLHSPGYIRQISPKLIVCWCTWDHSVCQCWGLSLPRGKDEKFPQPSFLLQPGAGRARVENNPRILLSYHMMEPEMQLLQVLNQQWDDTTSNSS